jgi:predicted membrane-bound spermidine synthase
MNAVGSIAGTFITGFVLFGLIGARTTLLIIIITVIVISWLIVPRIQTKLRIMLTIVILLITGLLAVLHYISRDVTIDTAIATYVITTGLHNGRPVTNLITGPMGIQSSVYQSGDKELIFWYTREIARIVEESQIAPSNILIIGGGAYTMPEYFAKQFPDSLVDVVEIDPELVQISKRYFRYEPTDNIRHYATDARGYINTVEQRYDLVIVDVFSDSTVPWQFVTREYGDRIHSLVQPDGMVIVNTITAQNDDCQPLTDALAATYSGFGHAYYSSEHNTYIRGNIEMIFSDKPLDIKDIKSLPRPLMSAYTDDYAPIEFFQQQCVNSL